MPWQPRLSHRSAPQHFFPGMSLAAVTAGSAGCRGAGGAVPWATRRHPGSSLASAAGTSLGCTHPTPPRLRGLPRLPAPPEPRAGRDTCPRWGLDPSAAAGRTGMVRVRGGQLAREGKRVL